MSFPKGHAKCLTCLHPFSRHSIKKTKEEPWADLLETMRGSYKTLRGTCSISIGATVIMRTHCPCRGFKMLKGPDEG